MCIRGMPTTATSTNAERPAWRKWLNPDAKPRRYPGQWRYPWYSWRRLVFFVIAAYLLGYFAGILPGP